MTEKEITKFIDDSLEFSRGILDASGNYVDAFEELERAFEHLLILLNTKNTRL